MRGRGTWIGRFLGVALIAALACAAAAAAAEVPAAGAAPGIAPGAAAAAQPPVRISADAAEYFNKEGLVIFSGNVVAVQSDSTLTAERMEVTFSAPEPAGKKPAGIGGAAGGRRITTITALKSVTLRQVDPETKKERYATGDKGVYDAERRLVTMTGSPRLWEDKNVIVGEEMIFHLEDRKVIVSGKVNLTVLPDDAKEGKKP